MANRAKKYQTVFGENLRRIREEKGLRQDAVAKLMALPGWTQATVAAVEAGRRALALGEALLLQQALQCSLFDLGRLPAGEHTINVEGAEIAASEWDQLTHAQPAPRVYTNARAWAVSSLFAVAEGSWSHAQWTTASRVVARFGLAKGLTGMLLLESERLAERRAARRLGVEPLVLTSAAYALWGHSLTEERDSRAERSGNDASDRMRAAHVTRELQKEIAARIKSSKRRRTGE